MDPFIKLPEDIHDHLLQHLDVKEVLEVVSLVSKSWYQAVATSLICMKKIRLHLKARRKTNFSERIETLQWMSRKEGRNYQHLQINCLLDESISREVFKFLMAKGSSVETINIRSCKFEEEDVIEKLSMPKLEELKVMFVPRDAMNSLLTSTSCLKRLILWNEFPLCYDGIDYTPKEATLNSVKECLQRNLKLEEIEIQGRPNFLSFFQENLSEFKNLSLKKFVVKIEMSAEKIVPENEENLLSFLKIQAHCLEHVYVDSCSTQIIQQVFNEMPALKFIRFDIELREPNKFVIKDMNLSPNEKIKQLEIPYIPLLDDVKVFLDLVPNVEEILVAHLNPLLIEYASVNLLKLKTIVYRYDDCAEREEHYRNKKTENPEFNQNIQFKIYNDFL